MQIGTVDVGKLCGVGDKFIGLSKELAGVLIDNDRLQRAGEAQQEKATETLKALRDEARAEVEEARAAALHRRDPGSSGSGVVAEVKGKAKQAVGDALGDSELHRDGRNDEQRGEAGRRATQKRVSAKAHEEKAKAAGKAEDQLDEG